MKTATEELHIRRLMIVEGHTLERLVYFSRELKNNNNIREQQQIIRTLGYMLAKKPIG